MKPEINKFNLDKLQEIKEDTQKQKAAEVLEENDEDKPEASGYPRNKSGDALNFLDYQAM